MFWVGLSNLALFINSVVWDGNVENWSPVWCDITTRLIIGANVAIPATALCIQRRLYYIISDPVVKATKAEKRRSIMVDLMIGLGLPVLSILLAYVVQGHQYDIYEDVGCFPYIINTALSYVLISAWPIAIGLVTGIYCSLSIYHIWIKRRTIRALLSSTGGFINFSRYIRLSILSGIDILCTLPLAVWLLYSDATLGVIIRWPGWDAVHANFSQVGQVPAVIWRSDNILHVEVELTRWSNVVCAIIFFIFFGFAEEARRHYALAFWYVAKKIGYKPSTTELEGSQNGFDVKLGVSIFPDDFVLPIFAEDLPKSPDKAGPLAHLVKHESFTFRVSQFFPAP